MSQLKESQVVEKLAEEGLNATPDAVDRIAQHSDPDELVRRLRVDCSDDVVVTLSDVEDCLENPSEPVPDPGSAHASADSTDDTTRRKPEHDRDETPSSESHTSSTSSPPASSSASESTGSVSSSDSTTTRPSSSFSVSNDVTGESTCTGSYDDFVGYFRDRFERLSGILRSRLSPRTIESAKDARGATDVTLVGMVNDIRTTSSSNRLVEIEDTTGSMRLLFSDKELIEATETLVTDEVIGVDGRLSDDAGIVFVDEIYHPDVPPRREPDTASRQVRAALVSDVHVGSENFVAEKWRSFTDWLSDPEQNDLEYVLVAGDLVEGVGVYPDQDEELDIVDIYEQYEACAEMFKRIPDDIEVICITGNHDSVRLAEPQPALPEDFRDPFDSNVRFVGNPATVDVEGVSITMYHGVSINPLVEKLPRVEIKEPQTAMEQMLKKRHLAPMYGDIRLAPEESDYMVVDDVPDVLHTGHVHKIGADVYNSVRTVNTGAWQSQTAYQKAVNIDPDVGYAAVLDLSTLEMEFRDF